VFLSFVRTLAGGGKTMSMLWLAAIAIMVLAVALYAYKTGKHDMAIGMVALLAFAGILVGIGVISVGDTDGLDFDGGGADQLEPVDECDDVKTIASLSWIAMEAKSNKWDQYDFTANYFASLTSPSDPNNSAIDTTTVTDGNGTDTTSVLQSCRPYRVVLDGGSTYYDIDLGETVFKPPSSDESSVTITEIIGAGSSRNTEGGVLVGTISDIVDETVSASLQGTDTNTVGNDVNELRQSGDALTYDHSDGDGQFKVRTKIECTGANKVCRNMAFGYTWDSTTPPEGNEISGITPNHVTGTQFGAMPSSLLNMWSTQSAVLLGDIEGGISGTYDITYDVTEANATAGDDVFYQYLDDLGEWFGKDVMLGTKATGDRTSFNWQA